MVEVNLVNGMLYTISEDITEFVSRIAVLEPRDFIFVNLDDESRCWIRIDAIIGIAELEEYE